MNMQRVVDILKTEKECVERAGTATPNKACNHECSECDLLLDDTEILQAYTLAIGCIEGMKMDDKVQIKLLNDAIRAYEDGEILEAKDMAIEFNNNITDFETESEDKE